MNKTKITKYLAYGVIVMGFVHIAATFSPVIDGKLAPLNEGMHDAVIYFSLMCGAFLILGGSFVSMMTDKVKEYPFLRRPYMLTLIMLALDGILAAWFMPHNPCAWVILVLSLPLLVINLREIS